MLFRKVKNVLRYGMTLSAALTSIALSGCMGGATDAAAENSPTANQGGQASGAKTPTNAATSCVSNDPDRLCIGVKVVAYTENGNPVINTDRAQALMEEVNDIWKSCNIAFQMEEFTPVDPEAQNLAFGESSQNQTSEIREAFSNDTTFLLAVTGAWNSNYIAWTAMPGSAPYGVVVDFNYADAVTTAHEFGHYVGLDHADDNNNLMYYQAEADNTTVSEEQCQSAREVALADWQGMLRR